MISENDKFQEYLPSIDQMYQKRIQFSIFINQNMIFTRAGISPPGIRPAA